MRPSLLAFHNDQLLSTVILFALGFLIPPAISAAPPQATFYVSPDGLPTAPGTPEAPCSLERVRDLVRKINGSMKGDIVVNLRGGTYALKAPFKLREDATTHDSGTGGFNVIYQACPGEPPVLSGGVPLTGWTLFDKGKNIYSTKAPEGTDSRQLYVNGRRADRARSELDPKGWTRTEAGWSITDPSMQHWSNISDMEIVSRASWKHLRCGIASIAGNEVTMKMPGWHSVGTAPREGHPFSGAGAPKADKVAWVENALELLKTPGQWYLDRKTRSVYCIPLPSENLEKAMVVMPRIEKVLDVSGSDFPNPIHNIQFKGISFLYGTWLGPNGDQGYADNQTGVVWVNDPRLTECWRNEMPKMASAVTI